MFKLTLYLRDLDSKPFLYYALRDQALEALASLQSSSMIVLLEGATHDGREIAVNTERLVYAELTEVAEVRLGGQVVGPNQAEMPRATEVTNR